MSDNDTRPPVKCPTCGNVMQVGLFGKINPVYVLTCNNPTVVHPVYVVGPGIMGVPIQEYKP